MAAQADALADALLPPFPFSDDGRQTLTRLRTFLREEVKPNEETYEREHAALRAAGREWEVPPIVEALKEKAKAAGLWNLFLPERDAHGDGPGLSTLDYAPLAEAMGSIVWSPEIFNCSAPDTGNMEVLARYGSDSQKARWLAPLLDGKIRSAFCMTEPGVASSDATNMALRIRRVRAADGGTAYVLDGRKWWASGVLDPRCELLVVMGRTEDADSAPAHKQHSMLLVPRHTPGVRVVRHLSVFGYDDAPHGHGEVTFENVIVPGGGEALVLGEGRGFEIAQGRLGPGRIHHCMRAIGLAEHCLALLCARLDARSAFGSELSRKDIARAAVAESRLEIEQARLLVLRAAQLLDAHGPKAARGAIAMIKVVAPRVGCAVADRAIQFHGGAGVSQDTILARVYAGMRTLRLADGPDEVHLLQVGRLELALARRLRALEQEEGTSATRPQAGSGGRERAEVQQQQQAGSVAPRPFSRL